MIVQNKTHQFDFLRQRKKVEEFSTYVSSTGGSELKKK